MPRGNIVICPTVCVHIWIGILTKWEVILRHYLLSLYFVLDVAAVIPLEFLGLLWDSEERYGYIAVLRLNRLIKVWKVREVFNCEL